MLEPERRQAADFVSLPEIRKEGYKKIFLEMEGNVSKKLVPGHPSNSSSGST
jgi:hypothetical protein